MLTKKKTNLASMQITYVYKIDDSQPNGIFHLHVSMLHISLFDSHRFVICLELHELFHQI